MFREDICLSLIGDEIESQQAEIEQTLRLLIDALSVVAETPRERIINAVKDEIMDQLRRAQQELGELLPSEASRPWLQRAQQLLRTNTCYFPREELREFIERLEQHPEVCSEPGVALLIGALTHMVERHEAFERRLGWLLKVPTLDEIKQLDPVADCDQIFHFLSYDFRAEMKIFAVLYELRASVASSLPPMFNATEEFNQRSVRRIVDTVLLFANVLEWGIDSYRGRFCVSRINEIHGRYYIPNDGFKYVLAGIMFVPHEWNERFGWRKFTDVERLGWFHAFAKMGRAMNIQAIGDDFDEMYAWYKDYSRRHAGYGAVKRQMFDNITTQVLAEYPPKVRPALLTAIVAGMDDAYHTATGYPAPPPQVYDSMKAVFFTVGHAGNALPRGPWIRSLQSNVVYPHGYRIEELGVPARSSNLPSLCPYSGMGAQPVSRQLAARPVDDNQGYPSRMLPLRDEQRAAPLELPLIAWDEVRKHNRSDDLWVVIDGYVYDLTTFASGHPGGLKILSGLAGKDASAAFARQGHSAETQVFKLNFRIGRIDPQSAAQPAEQLVDLGVGA